ncbi:hypothetical protein [Paraburkholderia hospita]|uniref:hypothetical protein n=1 Tax=Paraburkholderia hospita TaxID=169430 RepID=UPI001A992C90|nr:hypothetical protein [Paraburkholderia hospita]
MTDFQEQAAVAQLASLDFFFGLTGKIRHHDMRRSRGTVRASVCVTSPCAATVPLNDAAWDAAAALTCETQSLTLKGAATRERPASCGIALASNWIDFLS